MIAVPYLTEAPGLAAPLLVGVEPVLSLPLLDLWYVIVFIWYSGFVSSVERG